MTDLVIRGMEMPKEGEKILIAADGSVWVNAWPTRGYMRMENVYAVPLPEGHGDLIDKQAFIADIAGFIECMSNVGVLVDGETLWGKLLDALANAKTIVPAEGGTDDGN